MCVIISGYIRTRGKARLEKEEDQTLYPSPPEGDYAALYVPGAVARVDIDDFSHKTGEIEEPIHGEPRSTAVLNYLNENRFKYNAIRTEHGIHLVMRMPEKFQIQRNNEYFCALGVKIEVHVNGVFEPLQVNGIKRQFIEGSIENDDIDPLPPALYPVQSARKKKFQLTFEAGGRNNRLSEYAFFLCQCGLTAEQTKDSILAMNAFVLEDPLPNDEIETILRPDTLEKLKRISEETATRNLSHVDIGNEIMDSFNIIRANRQFYRYRGGIYIPADEEMIDHFIRIRHPGIKKSQKAEAMDYLKGMTYVEDPCPRPRLINVKNGLLDLNHSADDPLLVPHDPEIKRFTQFNAEYDPEAKCPILVATLEKFFDGDSGMIALFRQMMGYLLMNSTIYQKCFFFVGPPSSGKSSILNMVTAFCGRPYVSTLSLKDLDTRFRPAAIIGKVANINADLKNSHILTSGNFKSLVTGDGITLELKGKDPVENYVNTAKLIFGCNQYPDFSKDPEGVFRRVIVFPCNHVFSRSDPDYNPRIDHDLQTPAAMSTLLNMAIEGYFSLQANNGFIVPQGVERAGDDFRAETDSVFRWLRDEEITVDYLLREPIRLKDGSGLYSEYCRFVTGEGEDPKPQREFTRSLCNEFGLESKPKKHQGVNTQMLRRKQ